MSITIAQSDVNRNEEWTNSNNINIDSFSLSIGKNKLYDDARLNINVAKYGFLGHNGAGKSTLLRAIYQRQFHIPPNLSIYYVEQEILNSKINAVEAVMQADLRNIELLNKEKDLSWRLENDDSVDEEKIIDQLNKISEELSVRNIDTMEPKARKILYGLGFTIEMQNSPTNSFSGGWQMRISLARGLFMEPQLLLLDEPTNHLDLNAVIWLNSYLTKWNKGLIVVSHDQDFMANVCTHVMNLENKKIQYYACNYDKFKIMHRQKIMQYNKLWEQYLKTVKRLKSKGKYNKKNDNEYRRAKIDGNKIILQKPEKEYKVNFGFNDPYIIRNDVTVMKDVTFGYDEDLFENVDFSVGMNDRIVIVGPNGVGKSTFLKLLMKELDPDSGEVEINGRSRIGTYNQHFMDRLPMDKSSIEYLKIVISNRESSMNVTEQDIRKLLGRFGLRGDTHKLLINQLSGGQKARVAFASLYIENPNVIFLDEPTNNLDIESVDALITAINEFEGGMVIITHDIKLIEETECQLYICDNKKIIKYNGDINDYKEEILKKLDN